VTVVDRQIAPSSAKASWRGPTGNTEHRSLPICEWPKADQEAWSNACVPGSRLRSGGAASHLAEVSRATYGQRYGAFLGFLERAGRLDRHAPAGAHVTERNVKAYVETLQVRVRSVTTWNCVSKLRCAAKLIAPAFDFSWLAEIENDLALIMEPRSKLDRLVLAERLIEAGLALIVEAEHFSKPGPARARGARNGLMIAMLARFPIRLKNFAALEIGKTIQKINGSWWIVLPDRATKTKRFDERRIDDALGPALDRYIECYRPLLMRANTVTDALWLSSTDEEPMHPKSIGTLISKITRETLGVDVSPHLFRTAAASTAAIHGGDTPHLASGVLGHTDPRVTEKHYNRATGMSAAQTYAAITETYRRS
jgi:integrase